MKAKIYALVLLLPLLALVPGCSKPVAGNTSSQQLGEKCSPPETDCMEGLYCEDGTCRAVCQNDDDCGWPDSQMKCKAQRCVKTIEPTNNNNNNNNQDAESDNHNNNHDSQSDAASDNPGPGPNIPTERAKAVPPAGYGLAPVAGKTSGERFKIRVVGGSLTGAAQNEVGQQVIVSDGAWNNK